MISDYGDECDCVYYYFHVNCKTVNVTLETALKRNQNLHFVYI